MSLKKNENIKVNVNKLEIFVDAKTFSEACNKAYFRERKKIRVPGFRIGKAPKKVIESIYGKEIFYQDAIDYVYKSSLDDAIRESKLDVVAVDDFQVLSMDEEKGFCYSINCILKPKIEVKKYKEIEVKKPVRKITEKDVDERIMELRERVGRAVEIEEKRPAKKDDLVVIDFTGFVDGISFKGGSSKNYNLKLGSGHFIKGFEEQIEGHKVGDEFDILVTFPQDYHSKELQGKEAVFKCKLNSIKKIELPDEDDEFAKDVSEFSSLKELREDIKKKLEKADADDGDRVVENKVLDCVIENVDGEIPEVMVENKYNELLEDFKRNIKRQRLTLEDYFSYRDVDEEEFKEDLKKRADYQVKLALALERIIELEKIEANQEDYDEEIKNMAEQYRVPAENIKNIFPEIMLKSSILNRKAIKFVKDNAKIEEEIIKD